MARPTDYKPEYINKIDEYLKEHVDTTKKILIKVSSKGSKEYMEKTIVNLPTIEGFAEFIGVARKTIYNWKRDHKDFSDELEKIETVQLSRLINNGLSGNYNSTIAKLVLSANHGMRERWDGTSDDQPLNTFTDEQVDKIANRIAGRKRSNGNKSIKK